MAICLNCKGEGKVEAVDGHRTYGLIECDECDGAGAHCDSCEEPMTGTTPAIGSDLCFACWSEAAESDNADVLGELDRAEEPF